MGITAAVYIQLDRDRLTKRITGRRICSNCQAVYHVESKPPQVDGVCDACGGAVVQRADDADEAAVARRLELYFDQTAPVIEYYRGKHLLKEVDGDQDIEAVQTAVLAALEPVRRETKGRAKAAKKRVKKLVKRARPTAKKTKAATKETPAKKAASKKVTRRKQGGQ
jgi:hypothetical protein